jgi:hypothetical protein
VITFKRLAITFALVFLALLAWRYRNSELIQSFINPEASKPKSIQFDNGTVRQYLTPAEIAATKPTTKPPGELRKCKKGGATSYTNDLCPPGAKEYELTNGTINVVDNPNAKVAKDKEPTQLRLEPEQLEPNIGQRRIDQAIRN